MTVGFWLKADSPAEEWCNDMTIPKGKYSNFEAAFKQHFPNAEKAKKIRLELKRELAGIRFRQNIWDT